MRTLQKLSLRMTAAVLFAGALTLSAMWAYIPPDVRLMEAECVVIGTIDRLDNLIIINENGRIQDVGMIKIERVLKGDPKLKEAALAWPRPDEGPFRIADGPISFRLGQKGLWILRRDEAHPVFRADYPGDYKQADQAEAVTAQLKALDKLQWSAAKDGLQATLLIEQRDMRNAQVQIQGKKVVALSQPQVNLLLRNDTDKPLFVVDHFADQPVQLTYQGPNNQAIEVKLYGDPAANPPAPQRHSYKLIPPRGVRSVGYGFGLPVITQAGEYKLTLDYKNKRDGQALGLKPVWQGQITTPLRKFRAPPNTAGVDS
ncbi:MAG: hypothetical protein EXS24_05480 [Pedosphaera sp.]|nr:hypothetical protein [Pedosphaera sp.]